jgi:hypothetical protein
VNSVTVRALVAQLPWEPLVVEGVAEGVHEDHGLVFSHAQEQAAGVARTARAVALLQDDWALIDSWSVAYDGTHEDCADAVEVEEVVGVLTCIVAIQSRLWSSCPAFW